jgi:hypothetical protein
VRKGDAWSRTHGQGRGVEFDYTNIIDRAKSRIYTECETSERGGHHGKREDGCRLHQRDVRSVVPVGIEMWNGLLKESVTNIALAFAVRGRGNGSEVRKGACGTLRKGVHLLVKKSGTSARTYTHRHSTIAMPKCSRGRTILRFQMLNQD